MKFLKYRKGNGIREKDSFHGFCAFLLRISEKGGKRKIKGLLESFFAVKSQIFMSILRKKIIDDTMPMIKKQK